MTAGDLFCHNTTVKRRALPTLLSTCTALMLSICLLAAAGSVVTIDTNGVLVIDGKKVFPIGFTRPPPPDGKAPNGKNGIEELRDAGATFLRTGVWSKPWDDDVLAEELKYHDAAAKYGMHCWVFLDDLAAIPEGDMERERMLRKVVSALKDHPGLGVWKGADEPEWGKQPIPPMLRARAIIRELDPNHPIAVTHAPRGTIESLRPYNETADITGADIYPISYPPGIHSLGTNKEISMVGDYTRKMMEVADGKMPVWMILQIAWSGVSNPGKTLRYPTFPEERFMVYQAIINGARGLIFFGGSMQKPWNEEDAKLKWNWTFWNHVLRRVVEEIGDKGPLYPALVAPNAAHEISCNAADIEFCVRQTDQHLFLLACKRGNQTVQVKFTGLRNDIAVGEVLYESPRQIEVRDGAFADWFAPFEVHVYRFKTPSP